jgi:hypothetical protein
MTRLPKIASLTLLSCLLLLLAAWGVRVVYVGYTVRMERITELESKVQELKHVAHAEWRVRQGRFSISTTDLPDDIKRKDFRLVYGTNAVQKFDYAVWKEPGHIVTAWVSEWTPRSEMAKFEEFNVSCIQGSRFEVLAKAHTNQSIAMEFTVTFIVE